MQSRLSSARMGRTVMATLLLLAPGALPGQASPNVPIGDPAYRDVERLIHRGVLDSVIVSQRPFTRAEFRRIAAVAAGSLASAEPGTSDIDSGSVSQAPDEDWRGHTLPRIIERLNDRFAGGELAGFDELSADATAMSSPPRVIPDNGLGHIVATLNPLAERRQGRAMADGSTLSAALGARFEVGGHLAGAAGIRHSLVRVRGSSVVQQHTAVERLYVTLGLRNLLLQLGRDQLALGAGESGLLVSGNGPSLDLVKLTTGRPFVMPGVLRRFGPTRFTIFATDLGAGRVPNHDWLVGYRASILPHRNVELGVSVGSQQGGSGSTRASAIERVADLFPLIDVLFNQDGDLEISDKYSGIDVRWRLPRARAMELYGDLLLDDFDHRRFVSTFRDDAAVIAGVTVPRLMRDGRLQGGLEYQRTGIRFYTHGEFRHGLTRQGFILGNPLGPDAHAGVARLTWSPGIRGEMTLIVARERRSGDRYTSTGGYGDETLRFIKVDTLPKETRLRATVRVEGPAAGEWTRLIGEAGVERVDNFGFTDGARRTNTLARLGLEARF